MDGNKNLKILLVDDHVIIRRGLRFLIEMHFGKPDMHETDSVRGLLQQLKENSFTHLVLDMQLKNGNVIDVFEQVRNNYPALMILIYTMSSEEIFGKRLLNMGANGFLSKQSNEEDVLHALDIFFKGKKYISTQLDQALVNDQQQDGKNSNPIMHLSHRELQVLSYLLKGEGVSDIAARLNVKPNTIGTFKARIFDKLGASNLFDLQKIAELYHFEIS